MLSSVRSVLYVYSQPKPNISVCEILNRNRPKWLEIFQREGFWDFQNPNFNHIKKEKKKLSNRAVEQSWWTKLIQSDRERNAKREKEKRRIIPWEKKEDDRVVWRPVCGGRRQKEDLETGSDCGVWCVRVIVEAALCARVRMKWEWQRVLWF